MSWAQELLLTFMPLFIVMDVIGNVPVVIAFAEGMGEKERRHLIDLAVITAAVVGLIFLFGNLILAVLGLPVGSFTIAGGIVLLVLSIKYIATGHFVEEVKEAMIAVVPIGTPLVVGPATITTLLLLSRQYSIYMVLVSFALNLGITWFGFVMGNRISRFLGIGGMKALSKVFSLLLAAIAVNMILRGLNLSGLINQLP